MAPRFRSQFQVSPTGYFHPTLFQRYMGELHGHLEAQEVVNRQERVETYSLVFAGNPAIVHYVSGLQEGKLVATITVESERKWVAQECAQYMRRDNHWRMLGGLVALVTAHQKEKRRIDPERN